VSAKRQDAPPPNTGALLATAEERLGVGFSDRSLLLTALTHPSYAFESGDGAQYERLEFLGDSVLGTVVTEHIYRTFPELPEGPMAKLRAALVAGASLAEVAAELGLSDCVLVGRGAEVGGARKLASVLADVFEAVVGAIYLDAGLEATRSFVHRVFGARLEPETMADAWHDPKSELQERAMASSGLTPTYAIVTQEGPPHRRLFTAEARLGDRVLGSGSGPSKKDAEQAAAAQALAELDRPARPRRRQR
jgi:ribonuclease-3